MTLRAVGGKVSPPTRLASLFMGLPLGAKVEPSYSLKVRWVHGKDRQVVCYRGCGDYVSPVIRTSGGGRSSEQDVPTGVLGAPNQPSRRR